MASDVTHVHALERAKSSSRHLRLADGTSRNAFLKHLGDGILGARAALLEANARDLAAGRDRGLSKPMLDRLALNDQRIDALAENARAVAALPDPVGAVTSTRVVEKGLRVERRRIPLGVLMMIYEARPNATIEASALAVKSGNAIVLRGGSEAEHTNRALGEILQAALVRAGLPKDAIQVLAGVSREDTIALLARADLIDLVIPRGGPQLIATVRENARMPMLSHGPGICHVYVDVAADLQQALSVTLDGKTDRPATCNSTETLLVHAGVSAAFLPMFGKSYIESKGELRACAKSAAILGASGVAFRPASDADFATEHLDNILNLMIVEDMDAALQHIDRYGTRHTDAIITTSLKAAERFTRDVDSSCVLVNASTRLNDGFCLGYGAELGISTAKFHAFGPMGLEALTIEKNVAVGDGQTRR
jgi:glutamate-5-semialdehyde dehydrogenase